jgi:hypothetical protein
MVMRLLLQGDTVKKLKSLQLRFTFILQKHITMLGIYPQ